MTGHRFTPRLRQFTSFIAGFLTLFVLTLALAPRAEAFVYWTSHRFGGTIGRANLDGTGVDQRFIADASTLGMAVGAGHIYWTGSDTVARANFDGTGIDPSFITGAVFPTGVAVDAAHVYWANSCDIVTGPGTCFGDGSIGRANLDGTGVDQRLITAAVFPRGVAVDAEHVFWTADGVAIGRANLDGSGANQSFITAANVPQGPAVDEEHVYWTVPDIDAIGRANLDGTGVDEFFITARAPAGVAVDAGHIYWAAGNTIGRAKLDGTHADRRFITGVAAQGVAVDSLRSFSFGNVKRNKSKGTARLTVKVPGPGTLKLAKTKRVKRAKKRADAEGSVKLPVKSRGNARKKLDRKGKAKVEAEVAYTPTDGDPTIVANSDTKTVKLVKRR